MISIEFPLYKTKSPAGSPVFDLNDPEERKKYFADDYEITPEVISLIKQLADLI